MNSSSNKKAAETRDALKRVSQVIAAGPFHATWESLLNYRIPKWYEDAKFGIFLHWGVYSVPAFGNEWYPRNMYVAGSKEQLHHVQTYGPLTRFGYKDFVPRFLAEHFDPDAWIELFEKAGAKFVMPVAEHHDGFAMYDCSLSEWTAVKKGPKRDLIGALSESAKKKGMIFSVSSHRAENYWFYDQGMQMPSDVQDNANAGLYGLRLPKPPDQFNPQAEEAPPKKHLDDWLLRTCELVDKYQPSIVWFDWWIFHRGFAGHLKKFAAYYYNRGAQWDRGVAINYKYDAFPAGTAVFDVERGQLKDIRPQFWQTDTSVSRTSWGYVKGHKYKAPSAIIHDLIDIVSKNGAMLLNIGPKADGTIPDAEQRILLEIGAWLKINGEAIYGSRPWRVFGEGPTEVMEGSFTDTKRQAFTASDIRFTTREGALYAILLGAPADHKATIRSLGRNMRLLLEPLKAVSLLGEKGSLRWEQTADALVVDLPKQLPNEIAVTLKIDH